MLDRPRRLASASLLASAALAALLFLDTASAQDPTLAAPENGPRTIEPGRHVLRGGTVHFSPGNWIENGAVVVRDGRITWAGSADQLEGWDEARKAAQGARVWDCVGHHLYPGFIDPHVEVDPPPDAAPDGLDDEHFNPRVRPERSPLRSALPKELGEALRKSGFAAVAIAPKSGIFRGAGSLVSLLADGKEHPASVLAPVVYQSVAFERVRGRDDAGASYPDSKMGAIAVVRQVLSDVSMLQREFGEDERERSANPLMSLTTQRTPLLMFEARDELDSLRIGKIAKEFDRRAAVLGSGLEFRRLEAIRTDGLPHVVPLAFPKDPDVSTLGALDAVDLKTLMTWEQAPSNPRRLEDAGVWVALTTSDLDDVADFLPRLRKAIEHGLDPDSALAMLTIRPADLLGVLDELATIESGKLANIIVADGPIFDEDTKVRELWIEGVPHRIEARPEAGLEGRWQVTLAPAIEDEILLDFGEKDALTIRSGDVEQKVKKLERRGALIDFAFEHEPFGEKGVLVATGVLDGGTLSGEGRRPDGARFTWTAVRAGDVPPDADEDAESSDDESPDAGEPDEDENEAADGAADEEATQVPALPGLPFGAYAFEAFPAREDAIVRGATIWTSGPQGVIEDGVMIVSNGKIDWVGPAGEAPDAPSGARELDGTGLHVTPGLIDCHSHTGIQGGVNEAGQAVTAEVRIGDVTDPGSLNWYRELAGGLTTVNSLHGSANPIGGQNQVNKVRWGCERPDDMHFEGAPSGIKFALGENVKQANWGERFTTRYPQTRMGVEALMRDRFSAAREYAAQRVAAPDAPPRRDLELEALAEILAGERLVHCHSYRQDEILMLCRIAADFDFRIGTFQHVLEGYKVAEAIAERARGGSCFSDWWAYKVEVQDAIPEAGAIMHEQGVVVSFNSDSDELARRMNVEAAKAMKYGGLDAETALKFVTLNPAIQLGIEARVGSLEAGKDADFAVWSGPPLSSFSRCVATWIDGREMFTIERDARLRARDAAERARILQKVLAANDGGKRDKKEEKQGRRGAATSTRRAWEQLDSADHVHRGECADEAHLDLETERHVNREGGSL